MGRYSNLSTGSFKALSLQEIMTIPMAKQKMHDDAQGAANEYASLQASSLAQDREKVAENIGKLRTQADDITSTLLERGVDRNTMAKINELKRAKEKEFGQEGFIGNAQSNYASASAFRRDLVEKKDRQGGWGAGNAKLFADRQVQGFKGTDAGDGRFNSFSGRELEDYVDTNKWINDNISKVAADTGVIGLGRYKSVGEFETAWRSGTVEEKTTSKIIKALALQAAGDFKLQSSLKQSGEFSQEKDPTNIGKFEIVKRNGVNEEVFIPKSKFGVQLLGAASGAAYKKVDEKYMTITNHIDLELAKRKLDEKSASEMVIAFDSGIETLPAASYDNLKSSINLAKGVVDQTANDLRMAIARLPKGVDPNSVPEIVSKNRANQQAGIKYNNLFHNLEAIQNKANAGMNNIEKRRTVEGNYIDDKISKMLAGRPTFGEKIRGLAQGELVAAKYRTSQERKLGLTKEQSREIQMKVAVDDDSYAFEVKKYIMLNKGLLSPKDPSSHFSVNQSYATYLNSSKDYERKVKNYLKDSPASASYTTYDGSDQGAFKSVTGGATSALTNAYNKSGGQGWKHAETGESLDEFRAENPGLTATVMPTDGVSITSGEPIETLTLHDKDGVYIKSIPVTRGDVGFSLQRQVGEELKNSRAHSESGKKMIKNSYFGKDLLSLRIHQKSFKEGVIPNQELPDGSLPYIKKVSGPNESDSFIFQRIDKGKYLRSNGKDISPLGKVGSPAAGTDDIVNIMSAYNGIK